jgi:GxxExxY protein
MNENDVSYLIRGAIFDVYNDLGPGLLESAYESVLAYELRNLDLKVITQVGLPLIYKGIRLDAGYRIDMIIEDKVIIEVKSVEHLMEMHHKQVITYLRLSGLKLGILVNFNCEDIEKSIFRKVNRL